MPYAVPGVPPTFYISGSAIAQVSSYVYLGAIFRVDDPWFSAQWQRALQRAGARWALCRRAHVTAHGFSVLACRRMVFAHVIPLVEYAVEALPWKAAELQRCQTLITLILRFVMGAQPNESVVVCHSDMNIAPLHIRRHRSILRAFHRFTAGDSTAATQAVITASIRRAAAFLWSGRSRAIPCWGLQLHDALRSFRLLHFWNPIDPCAAIRQLDRAAWYKLVDDATPQVIHDWRMVEINAHDHLHVFYNFSRERRFASYLHCENPFLREFVLGLRAGSLLVQDCKPSLLHRRSPVLSDDPSSCPFCSSAEPETVTHFLLHCSAFATERSLIPLTHAQRLGCPSISWVCRDSGSKAPFAAGTAAIIHGWYKMWRARAERLTLLEQQRDLSLNDMAFTATTAALTSLLGDVSAQAPAVSTCFLSDDPPEPSDYDLSRSDM